jgi:hypothetical protein
VPSGELPRLLILARSAHRGARTVVRGEYAACEFSMFGVYIGDEAVRLHGGAPPTCMLNESPALLIS